MNKKFCLLLMMFGMFLSTFTVHAQNDTIQGIELQYVPNDGSNNPFVTSNNKWDNVLSVYNDETYDSFFHRSLGWNGGDGCYSTLLPDGNTFWSFADSFFGVISPGRVRSGNNLPRNAGFIQTGESADGFLCLNEYVQTQYDYLSTYYEGKTWLRHPEGEMTDAEIAQGQTDQNMLYWPGDATIHHGETGDTLQMLWGQVDNTMNRWETAFTEYTLEGKPGDEGYMKLVNYVRYFQPYTANYGSGIFEDEDGHTYLLGNKTPANSIYGGSFPLIARTETHDLKSKWTYYIKDTNGQWNWQETPPTNAEMDNSFISDGWIGEPNLFKYLDKYYLVGQEADYGQQVYIWQGDHPWGPFTNSNRKILYVTQAITPTNKPAEPGATYNAFLHPQLSKRGELVISFNNNPQNFWDNFNTPGSANLYLPYFVRIFNWYKLWNLPNPDPTAINNVRNDTQLNIYPNPVTDLLNVSSASLSMFRWKLLNVTGACLQSGKATGAATIPVKNYASGIYLLQIETQLGNHIYKIIKK